MKKLSLVLLFITSFGVNAKTCDGTIVEVNHWSDGQANKVNFRLKNNSGSMWIQTTTQEHVSMVLTSLASKMKTRVYWSCNAPASCTEKESQKLCGYLSLINE
ncbi:hypothetical protein VIBNISFn27_100002 [Vibrio nigripulchritudo SFn27]|uniref:Uncharacterized protein n=1 Tax=Vibrio nigripulchritudo TaxID=28173 RepID=U4K4Z2_9VIBR|nr:hypothetical protein [Vibrio nigripulchritudo]CCN81114.1 hypothetical protein VIBNIBLFn1_170002 [Vibrio nigripulchritudo BLFn1]CCN86230.1 hypothetical protein VIBNISFn27_100002 [Vibrio nigripulchritudo SFn27]CCN94332.1 hypothetical protein VIBNIENn2_360002 [Vibrio nigripulchritudo ENn2]CCO40378.1 hypothetical protein VIBNISFn135_370002 [Vibrio nigripulchritudo SFn135]CCO53326.1 hypothetical protein VIBNIWn13_460001 [Vibrio nigripulchritudo Wn13]